MVFVPIALFWAFAVWGFFSKKPALLYLFFCTMPFGSFAVLPPPMTAGLTFTPTPIIALLIVARSLGNARGINFAIASALVPNRLALFFIFWLVAAFTTIFMPRVFAGLIDIIPVRGHVDTASPLYPTNQNISQLAYITISILTVFAFARILQIAEIRQHAVKAICLGAAVLVFTGFLDYATQFLPIRPLLDPFRTASYALLTDVEVLGGKRVIGLMPEASSFGAMCLTFLTLLYFFRRVITDNRLRDRYVPPLLALLLLFAYLSTSSSAYVGIALFGLTAVMEWSFRASVARPNGFQRRGLVVEFWLAFAAIFLIITIIVVKPALLDPVIALVDRMVFRKTSSLSFEERSMWTRVSWQAAVDSFGLGVGLGATRPSNAFVAVVSGTGLLGALLFYGAVVQSLLRRPHPADSEGKAIINAIRWSFLPPFVVSLLVGTNADFGPDGAFRFGLAIAVAMSSWRVYAGRLQPASSASAEHGARDPSLT